MERERPSGKAQPETGIDAKRDLLRLGSNQLRRQPPRFGHAREDVPVGQPKRRRSAAVELFQGLPGPFRQRTDAGVVEIRRLIGPRELRAAELREVVSVAHLSLRSLGS
jgi:hypothetical protein